MSAGAGSSPSDHAELAADAGRSGCGSLDRDDAARPVGQIDLEVNQVGEDLID
jgi:hypothetical protein